MGSGNVIVRREACRGTAFASTSAARRTETARTVFMMDKLVGLRLDCLMTEWCGKKSYSAAFIYTRSRLVRLYFTSSTIGHSSIALYIDAYVHSRQCISR